jgi:hypothetical protein
VLKGGEISWAGRLVVATRNLAPTDQLLKGPLRLRIAPNGIAVGGRCRDDVVDSGVPFVLIFPT